MNWFNSIVSVASSKLEEIAREDEKEEKKLEALGITPEILEYVEQLTKHPQTFIDFPIEKYEKDEEIKYKLNPLQEEHAKAILIEVPALSDLRYRLCPVHIKENVFWTVYFLLITNKTGDAGLSFENQVPNPEPQNNLGSSFSQAALNLWNKSSDLFEVDGDNENSKNNNSGNVSISQLFQTFGSSIEKLVDPANDESVDVNDPKQLESYYEKLYSPGISESSKDIDSGILPQEDTYFSPIKGVDFKSIQDLNLSFDYYEVENEIEDQSAQNKEKTTNLLNVDIASLKENENFALQTSEKQLDLEEEIENL